MDMHSMSERENLEDYASMILARAGYDRDGREKDAKRESVRAISTPFGGLTGYKRK